MGWIEALGTLSPVVAIVVLYVWSQKQSQKSTIETIDKISECFVQPITSGLQEGLKDMKEAVGEMKLAVTNHLHDVEVRLERDSEDRKEHTEALERLVKKIEGGDQ